LTQADNLCADIHAEDIPDKIELALVALGCNHGIRHVLWPPQSNSDGKGEDKGKNDPPSPLVSSNINDMINQANPVEPPKPNPSRCFRLYDDRHTQRGCMRFNAA
jgi:hypothetical protein